MNTQAPRYLIFSIDTESDAPEWKDHGHTNLTFKNCESIGLVDRFAQDFGVRPTFLVTHALAGQKLFIDKIEPFLKKGIGEIGAHFHPGDTPPFIDSGIRDNVLRVSDDILNEKFVALHNQISSRFGRPSSFRCGAWTIDRRIIRLLLSYGYSVDSSVTPSISWRLIGRPDYLNAPASAYFLDSSDPSKPGETPLLEVPVTIWAPVKQSGPIGFIDGTFFSMPMESKSGFFFQTLKLLRHYKPLWLRPAFTPLGDMIFAARNLFSECDYIQVMCHSNELALGTSPYSNTRKKLDIIHTRLRLFFSYAREQGYIPCTLAEYAKLHATQTLPDVSGTLNHSKYGEVLDKKSPQLLNAAKTSERKSKMPGILKITLTISLLAAICLTVNLSHVWSTILAMNTRLLVIAVLLTLLTHSINAIKVKLILPKQIALPVKTLLNINFMSTFFNNIFPTRFGGDIARILYIGKALSSRELGLYTVFFDRLTGFLIQTVIVLTSCALLSATLLPVQTKYWCAAAAVFLVIASHCFLFICSRAVLSKTSFRFPLSFLNPILDHGEMRIFLFGLFENKVKHIFIHLAGYVFQSFVIITVMVLTYSMGGRITFFQAAVTLFIGTIACFLPLSIGGWGVMEGVFAYSYNFLHADAGIGLAVSLGLRITSVLPSLFGGLVFLKRNKETV